MLTIAVVIAAALLVGYGIGLAAGRSPRPPRAPHVDEKVRHLIAHAVTIRFAHEQKDSLRYDEGLRQAACEERASQYLRRAGLPEPHDLRELVRREIAEQLHEMAKASERKAEKTPAGAEGRT
jgi:hypothetical protein